jgi:hypothetical protein
MPDLAEARPTKNTEWKVRAASLASFAGALVTGTLLEMRGPEFIETLPDATKVFAGALLVAASSWLSGRAARSRPAYISQSTIDAVRVHLSRGR